MNNPIREILIQEKCEDLQYVNKAGTIASHIFIATGLAARHISSIADRISKYAKENNIKAIIDDSGDGSWIAIDVESLDTMVHLFTPERRKSLDFSFE